MANSPKYAGLHPGEFVRRRALEPKGLSVTEAAKLVGVGRPALSNFLNGNADVTPEMASRIERAFGVPTRELLEQQAAFDAYEAEQKGAPTTARRYVPPFLAIKATEIEDWATNNHSARTRLAVFIRTLVNSTGIDLTESDFPGNEDGERPGWDGWTQASQGTPWVPAGKTGWEFGVDMEVKGKADRDFSKSLTASTTAERAETTFIFVTPRKWAGKDKWAEDQRLKKLWKEVRAYDRSDLEQWLEQSIPGQAWFANETDRAKSDVRSLDKVWADWAEVSDPPLTPRLFDTAIDAGERAILKYLKEPPKRPFVLVADSVDEAFAFLSALISPHHETLGRYRDQIIIFDKPGAFKKVASSIAEIIAVASDHDVQLELAPHVTSIHTIMVYSRNAASKDPDVVLEPLGSIAFERALSEMGKARDEIQMLETESGRSLTVLRRRLSMVEAVRKPRWSEDAALAKALVPLALVGAWDSKTSWDCEAMCFIAGEGSYERLERDCHALSAQDDAPIWMVGSYRGLVSKIDALFAVRNWITAKDLERFFDMARLILGEDDPALDLPEEDRWLASMRGKSRDFSGALRSGVAESLVLLSVHGEKLFGGRLGIDCGLQAVLVVRELLTSDGKTLDPRKLEANERDLPIYAEAAPDEFLDILERDLRSQASATLGLMRPAVAGIFGGGCARTGLLWALEGLAWNVETFPRAVFILARLAEVEINDNWANKPINSLQSIFRSWMPQTSATVGQRIEMVKALATRHPTIAWQIGVAQFENYSQTGSYSHKPTWRPDGFGHGEPEKSWEPVQKFVRAMVDLALSWPSHDGDTLSDLVERIDGLTSKDQERVWESIHAWAEAGAGEEDKAWLRERIRVTVMSWRAARKNKRTDHEKIRRAAQKAYEALEPEDLFAKHGWLFRTSWVDESAEEIYDEKLDIRERDERISRLRTNALNEILQERGTEGIIEFACMGDAAWEIGWLISKRILQGDELADFLIKLISDEHGELPTAKRNLVSAVLHSMEDVTKRTSLIKRVLKKAGERHRVALLKLAPFDRANWQFLDECPSAERDKYWLSVIPSGRANGAELQEGVKHLMDAGRPRAAFAYSRFQRDELNVKVLFELLSAMAREGGNDRPGEYQLSHYDIASAFEIIQESRDYTVDQKAELEFAYLEILSDRGGSRGRGIPNLEKYIEAHPEFFVQAVAWAFRRDDGGEDEEPWRIEPGREQFFAERGYQLIDRLKRLPCHDDEGNLSSQKLIKWVETARKIGEEISRLEMTDHSIGQLLSASPDGEDGVWPCEAVRDVMELVQSEAMCSGFTTGKYNRRGVTWRGEGGQQERELATRYKGWANAIRYTHPFTATHVLDQMSESYTRDANWHDSEADIRKRLR
ncbi:hypothetical protein GCM10007420_21510 [Glycocaulis albus]|uniref:HTH cro/C1-type domain-containing protein n=1 Tax=Glycocaulis albus TaxID=1382801 RepID=A0ABQ1XW82_9PROT|nr:HigA family addiction module antitoxin [Glycocaulis albus]GGH04726.1 hypothetical protein GCM10007420_21510 [Glycocaulis albus]